MCVYADVSASLAKETEVQAHVCKMWTAAIGLNSYSFIAFLILNLQQKCSCERWMIPKVSTAVSYVWTLDSLACMCRGISKTGNKLASALQVSAV